MDKLFQLLQCEDLLIFSVLCHKLKTLKLMNLTKQDILKLSVNRSLTRKDINLKKRLTSGLVKKLLLELSTTAQSSSVNSCLRLRKTLWEKLVSWSCFLTEIYGLLLWVYYQQIINYPQNNNCFNPDIQRSILAEYQLKYSLFFLMSTKPMNYKNLMC